MHELGNASVSFRQIVDKDFYPVGGVFPVRVLPVQFIGEVADDMKWTMRKTISDLGIIDDPVNTDDVGATLWKLSKPYRIPK